MYFTKVLSNQYYLQNTTGLKRFFNTAQGLSLSILKRPVLPVIPGGGVLGLISLGMCRWPLRAPIAHYSLFCGQLWTPSQSLLSKYITLTVILQETIVFLPVASGKRLLGMYHQMGSHFHDWIDYIGIAFSIELLEWGRTFSDFGG